VELLEKPVRIGYPEGIAGLADVVHSPEYATGVGLLMYGVKRYQAMQEEEDGFFARNIFSRIKKWFQDLF